jgi:histone H3/H4
MQKSVENCIKKAPFHRLVNEIIHEHGKERATKTCREALQAAAENLAINVLEASYVVAQDADLRPRPTLMDRHLHTAMRVKVSLPGSDTIVPSRFRDKRHLKSLPRPQKKQKAHKPPQQDETTSDATSTVDEVSAKPVAPPQPSAAEGKKASTKKSKHATAVADTGAFERKHATFESIVSLI